HLHSITPETDSDEVTKTSAKNLLPIPSECEVTSEDKTKCDMLIYENSSTDDVCDNHSEILFDSNNDDLSSDDESFEDIEYVDASILDPKIASVEENVVHQEQEEVDLEEISQVQDVVLHEKLFSINRLIANFESLDDNPTPNHPIDLEPEVISAVMDNIDELNNDESFDPGGEIFVSTKNEDVDYVSFMYVIQIFLPYLIHPEISPLFLSAESEDAIFDPGISI
nr:hypothetical protein [Tanacetum cinerariifolium]